MRAGLAVHTHIQHQIAPARQRRTRAAAKAQHRNTHPRQNRQQPQNFLGFARIRQRQQKIATTQQPKITVQSLRRMQKQRWNTERNKRRGDLARDQPAFADPAEGDTMSLLNRRREPGDHALEHLLPGIFQPLRHDLKGSSLDAHKPCSTLT